MSAGARVMGTIVGCLALGVVIGELFCLIPVAKAGQDGLFAEAHAEVDGVTVRRLRDASNGTVCYVASGLQLGDFHHSRDGRNVAISCVRVQQ